VIVISHDDAYFPLADRMIKVDQGRVFEASREALAATAS